MVIASPEFLALLDCVSRGIAMAQASVRPSSVKCVFSETMEGINAKSCGKAAMHHISRPFVFKNFGFFNFNDFFSFSLTWDPMEVKIPKRFSSHSCHSFSTKLFLKIP